MMKSNWNCACYENNSFLLIMSQKICLACEGHRNKAVPFSSLLSEKQWRLGVLWDQVGRRQLRLKCIWVHFWYLWLLELSAKLERNHSPKTSLLSRWPLSLLCQRCPGWVSIKGTHIRVIVKVLTYYKLLMLNPYETLLRMNEYILDSSVGI